MNVETAVGPGGVRVIVDPVPTIESVCVAIWLAAGSRDERPAERGAAHVLEHLVLRGEIQALASRAGGQAEGITTPEYTCFHFRVPRTDWRTVFTALTAGLRVPASAAAMAAELPVILAEIRDKDDKAQRRVHELALSDLLGDHPLAQDPHGRPEQVRALTPADVEAFRRRGYGTGACQVVVSGNVGRAEVLDALAADLVLDPAPPPDRAVSVPDRAAAGWCTHPGDRTRAHLVMSFLAPGQRDGRRDALNVLNHVLGLAQDSFLWRRVRDELGLAYNVYSYRSAFSELGVLSVYASCAPHEVERVHDEVLAAMVAARDELHPSQVRGAARALAGSLALGLETPRMRANWLGRTALAAGRPADYRETANRLARVEAADVQELLDAMLPANRCAVTVLGPAEESVA